MAEWAEMLARIGQLAAVEGRELVASAARLRDVRYLPQQEAHVRCLTESLGTWDDLGVVVLALALHPREVMAIPGRFEPDADERKRWDEYGRAYRELNAALDRVAGALASEMGGVAEGATTSGISHQLSHVRDYYPGCASHRAAADAAGLGWRGRHGLTVTRRHGAAVRLATVFVPSYPGSHPAEGGDCGACRACLDACPILSRSAQHRDRDIYREACRRRMLASGVGGDACGICVRACWEAVRSA